MRSGIEEDEVEVYEHKIYISVCECVCFVGGERNV